MRKNRYRIRFRLFVDLSQVIFPRHANSFHIVEDDCNRDFIIPGNHYSPFCRRVMEDKMIATLADECTSRFFKYPHLRLPIRGGNFFHRASPKTGCFRKEIESRCSRTFERFFILLY